MGKQLIESIKISVITPTYNDESFVKETVLSVLNQTYSNIELIVVDDCSKDKTVELVRSINDSRIKLFINEKNRGAAYSRNRALKEATGDYIAFLDGDDLWEPTKLEKQLKFMLDNNYHFSCTNYSLINESNDKLGVLMTAPRKINHRKFMKADYIGCLTAMYKRDVIPDLQIPNDIFKRNDYALWLKVSEKVPCYLLSEELAFYRKREKSISSGSKVKLIKFHRILFMKLYNRSYFVATFLALRNCFYYIIKNIRYKKRV